MSDIKQINQLIPKKIISKTITNLTAPGENYGSEMLKVHLVLDDHTDLHLVAKTLPLNTLMQELFNSSVTFPKEIAFYETIFPTLKQFQNEPNGCQFVAEYFGSRLNLTNSPTIDSDAVLLLENLKMKGFINVNRMVGYDLQGAEVILRDLAELHGTGIALKFKQPEVFNGIKSKLSTLNVPAAMLLEWKQQYNTMIQNIPELAQLQCVNEIDVGLIYAKNDVREPFATISHNDCWVNNTMVRLHNGKVIENKFVDFQLSDYSSVAKDVLFFLFSSVQNQIITDNCDYLLRYYHNHLIAVLGNFNLNLDDFSFEKFQNELKIEAKLTQFAHLLLMTIPILSSGTDLKNNTMGKEIKSKIRMIVEEFLKREWLH